MNSHTWGVRIHASWPHLTSCRKCGHVCCGVLNFLRLKKLIPLHPCWSTWLQQPSAEVTSAAKLSYRGDVISFLWEGVGRGRQDAGVGDEYWFSWETPLNVNTQIHTLHACSWSRAQAWQCFGCLGNNNNNNIIYKWCNSRKTFLCVRSERTISLHIRSLRVTAGSCALKFGDGPTLLFTFVSLVVRLMTRILTETQKLLVCYKIVSLETVTLCGKRLYYTCIEISLQSTHTTYKSGRSALL